MTSLAACMAQFAREEASSEQDFALATLYVSTAVEQCKQAL